MSVHGILALGALALTVTVLAVADDAEATHYRGGSLHAEMLTGVTGVAGTVEAGGEVVLSASAVVTGGATAPGTCIANTGQLAWGDGSTTATSLLVTKHDPAGDAVVGTLGGAACEPLVHAYVGGGTYPIEWTFCCRNNQELNNANEFVRLLTTIDLDTVNRAPEATAWMESTNGVATCQRWVQCTIHIPVSDADGDALQMRMATRCEASGNCGFDQPGPPWADNSMTAYAYSLTDAAVVYWQTDGATPGTYSAQVIVTDGKTQTPIDFRVVVPPNERPVAEFTWEDPVVVGEPTRFTDLSYDPDGSVTRWFWITHAPSGTYEYTWHQHPTFTFDEPGVHTMRLRVTDDDGASSETTKNITVVPANEAPTAGFTGTGNGMTWTFTDTSTDDEGIVRWHWNFGDGTNSTAQHPEHRFAPGTYTVYLYVFDAHGAQGYVEHTVTAPCQQACTV